MTGTDIVADLRRLLDRHRPADPAEADASAAVLALAGTAEAFSAARYVPGHITASAFVVHPEAPAVALILHSKLGRWLQPGGHVEPEDHSIGAAVLREVREEIGVGASDEPWMCDVDIHTFPARRGTPEHLHHDVRLAFTADTRALVVGDGADDARWWTFGDAMTLEESIARPMRKLNDWWLLRN